MAAAGAQHTHAGGDRVGSAGEEPRARATALRRLWTPARLGRPIALRAYQCGLAFVLLLVLHAVLVNVLLLSGALGWFLTRATGVLRVETGRSFSLWPGVVQLRQLHLEVLDSNVHLALEVPHGRADILLRELLRRRFAAREVSGEHFVLRLRPRSAELSERRRAALPPLSEPVQNAGEGEPPYLWPIRITDSDARYDELWIAELRYRGAARVRGGFELVPLQRLAVDPSDVELRGGSLSYGPEQRALDLKHVQLHAELQQTEVEQLSRQWNEQLVLRLDLAGEVVDLACLENLSPELEGLSEGKGALSLIGAAERGQWQGRFELAYASDHIAYVRGPWRGSTALSLRAQREHHDGPLPASLRVERARLDARGKRVATLERLDADAALSRAFPFSLPRAFTLDLQGLALDQLEALPRALRPGRWQPRSAQLSRVHAELAWHEGVASGRAQARFRDASFGIGDWSLRQSGKLALQGVRWEPGSKLHIRAATLDLDPVQIREPSTEIDAWRVSLALQDVSFTPAAQRWKGDFLVAGDDARPALALLGVHGLPPGVSDFLAMPGLKVRGRLDLAPGRQELAVDRAESETIDVTGRLLRRGAENRAAFLFKAAPLSLGVEVQPDGAHAKPFAGVGWLEEHLRQLDAPPASAGVSPSAPGAPRDDSRPEPE